MDTQGDGRHGGEFVIRAIADVVDCLRSGRESMLSARHALRATELIFACWESVRRGGLVKGGLGRTAVRPAVRTAPHPRPLSTEWRGENG